MSTKTGHKQFRLHEKWYELKEFIHFLHLTWQIKWHSLCPDNMNVPYMSSSNTLLLRQEVLAYYIALARWIGKKFIFLSLKISLPQWLLCFMGSMSRIQGSRSPYSFQTHTMHNAAWCTHTIDALLNHCAPASHSATKHDSSMLSF